MAHTLNDFRLVFLLLFMALAPELRAQSAINSIANQEPIPMRNLQIEVRQVRDGSRSENTLDAQGGVMLQPGNLGATANITAQT
ncbi:MAG: hypothetical protein ACREXN_05075, partial [Polaromonas sp.]